MPERKGWRGSSAQSLPSYDPITEHHLRLEALEERAEKHGEEIDGTNDKVSAIEKRLDAARRWAVSLCMSIAGLLGHWQQEPLAKKAGAILSAAGAALK